MVERDIPGVGALDAAMGARRGPATRRWRRQWRESFVAEDKTFCVYLADSEATIREHARLSGFPATRITEVPEVIARAVVLREIERCAPSIVTR